jgi:hypothetical protein
MKTKLYLWEIANHLDEDEPEKILRLFYENGYTDPCQEFSVSYCQRTFFFEFRNYKKKKRVAALHCTKSNKLHIRSFNLSDKNIKDLKDNARILYNKGLLAHDYN